jgi:hypothetical protein
LIDRKHFCGLLQELAANRTDDFVGLGAIFYLTMVGLPVASLGVIESCKPELPICGEENVIKALATLATRRNPQHDGFHLIDAESGELTHVAQFVSPPLEAALASRRTNWPSGARQMTALLISLMPQVAFSAVVTADGEVQLYWNGKQATTEGMM